MNLLVTARPNHKDHNALLASLFGNSVFLGYLRGPFAGLDVVFVMVVRVAEAYEGSVGSAQQEK